MIAADPVPLTPEQARVQRRILIRRYIVRVSMAGMVLLLIYVGARVAAGLERQTRADCDFHLQLALVPGLTKYPSEPLVRLAAASRQAYIEKGCAGTPNRGTGKPFPAPPPTFKAVAPPATTPPRTPRSTPAR